MSYCAHAECTRPAEAHHLCKQHLFELADTWGIVPVEVRLAHAPPPRARIRGRLEYCWSGGSPNHWLYHLATRHGGPSMCGNLPRTGHVSYSVALPANPRDKLCIGCRSRALKLGWREVNGAWVKEASYGR